MFALPLVAHPRVSQTTFANAATRSAAKSFERPSGQRTERRMYIGIGGLILLIIILIILFR